MANFKFVVSDGETKKSYQFEVDQGKATAIIGKKIGEEFDAEFIGLSGYTLSVTGGTDRDGFPMYPEFDGQGKKKILLIGAPGFKPRVQGERKKKTVRGNVVSSDIMQVNTKVVKKGAKTLDEITGKTAAPTAEGEKKEEAAPAKPEAKQEAKPAEKPVEKKEAPEQSEKKVEEKKPETKKEAPKEEPKKE